MNAAEAVRMGQAVAESRMIDTCTIGRQSGVFTDPSSGQVVPTFTTVYAGKCEVQQTISQASSPVTGGHRYTVQNVMLKVPVAVTGLRIDDTVTLASAVIDPELVGRVFRLSELFYKSYPTARRFRVEEVVA